MKAPWFGLRYVAAHHFGKALPLIRGLVLTNRCNLNCRHCRVSARGPLDLDFAAATQAICAFRKEGGRCLYLEGGEPFLWRDREYTLEDVVSYAHRLGFLAVVVYTNGTFAIDTRADTVFVSVDGLHDSHDALRGKSFDRIISNIRASNHPSLFVNYTINNVNKDELRDFCEYADAIENIRGVFFYFHTPYYGVDSLYVPPDERHRILVQIMDLRRRHRILNSRAGLLSALRNDWKRPLNICSVYEMGTVHHCCRYGGDPELCRQCGYLSYAEIDQALKLKPSAVISALKYF